MLNVGTYNNINLIYKLKYENTISYIYRLRVILTVRLTLCLTLTV